MRFVAERLFFLCHGSHVSLGVVAARLGASKISSSTPVDCFTFSSQPLFRSAFSASLAI
jgi:hypothetical protein